jgi:hypothetical protein
MALSAALTRSYAGPPDAAALRRVVVCATVAMLAAIAVMRRVQLPSDDVVARAGRIEAAAQSTLPLRIGEWTGEAVPVPPAAVRLLRPTAILSRCYRDGATGGSANLLFVHCSDARDLLGHYPPVCYRARGHTLVSSADRDWVVDGVAIQGKRYRFEVDGPFARNEIVVDNFMVLPDGRFARDMESVDQVARDPELRRLGVAEVQVVTNGEMPEGRRDEALRLLAHRMMPLLQLCSSGATDD